MSAKAVADDFTIEKLKWLRQVAGNPSLPPQAIRLAVVLATDFVNRTSREAWPSMPTLEDRLGVKENAIRRASDALEAAGHMVVREGGGRNNPSRYRWVIQPENTFENEGVSDEKPRQKRKGFSNQNPSNSEVETPPFRTENPSISGGETPSIMEGEPFERNPMIEPIEGNPSPAAVSTSEAVAVSRRERPRSGRGDQLIEGEIIDPTDVRATVAAMLSAWPKKTGAKDAEAALAKALASGSTLAEVATGAAAYIADRLRDKRGPAAVIQFTVPLAKWIAEGQWRNWQGLPAAEEQAAADHDAQSRATLELLERLEAQRRAMPF